jgi:hypothetical protein
MDEKWEPPLIERLADIIYAQAIPGWDMGDAFALAEELLAEIGTDHMIVSKEDAAIAAAARRLFDEPAEWDEIQVNTDAADELIRLLGKD